ncbi:hypothetical protein TBC1_1177 [Lentimicrobium saccharophilum]|uniref:Uncharacterized protein n=1 Tax=Lentimicrobium saccharophilum TaxID=1678841 RepID=A0A0S7BP26_9BACT|nr:hypothetical protein [Lentimicrobium saccharophilum]GAP41949.1 hypothetical protein TBC1_1177 [Lentimicrobium saccharophilum]
MNDLKIEISNLLKELNGRFEKINASGEAVPAIEADIVLSLLRQLYVKTEQLKDPLVREVVVKAEPVQYQSPVAETPVKVPEFTPPAPPHIPEPPRMEVEPPRYQTPEQPVPAVPEQPVVAAVPPAEFFHVPAPEPPVPAAPTQSPRRPEGLPDLFGSATDDKHKTIVPSVNERIQSGKNDLTLSDKMSLKPIADLKATIGINEKFQFVNELFDGSTEMYNQAIALLNNCSGQAEATSLFAGLQQRNGWDPENPVFLRLLEYVTRRYITSG